MTTGIGDVVRSTAGHERGQILMVLREEGEFL